MLFLPFIFLSSCGDKTEKTEANSNSVMENSTDRLSEKELVPILKDVLLIESAIYFKANQGIDIKPMTNFYYNKLFKKYSISRSQFYNSLKYHLQKDVDASSMFLEAINILTVETDSVRKNETSLKDPSEIVNKNNQDTLKSINRFFGKRPK